jgi:hypothetical protein
LEFDRHDQSLYGFTEKGIEDLEVCHQIFRACDEFLHRFEVVQGSNTSERFDKAISGMNGDANVWIQNLSAQKDEVVLLLDKGANISLEIDESSAASLVSVIEELCECVADKDVARLRNVVTALKSQMETSKTSVISDAVTQLHRAVEKRDADFEELLELTDQLLSLNRMNRSGVIQSILSDNLQEDSLPSLSPA